MPTLPIVPPDAVTCALGPVRPAAATRSAPARGPAGSTTSGGGFVDVELSWDSLKIDGVTLPSLPVATSGAQTPHLRPRQTGVALPPTAAYRAAASWTSWPLPAGEDVEPDDGPSWRPVRRGEVPLRPDTRPRTTAPRRGTHVEVRHRSPSGFGDDDGLPPPLPILVELYALADIRFTGTARGWFATVTAGRRGAAVDLRWDTLDRDTGAPLRLVYRTWSTWGEIERLGATGWLQEAIRYVFRHEAEETLVLADGTRPFDPHAPDGRLREPR